MLSKKMEKSLNEQLNEEFFSSYLYLAMAAQFESENLDGFAGWMRAQAEEEVQHAMKFYRYLNDRGGRVVLGKIAAPPSSWKSVLVIFEEALKHEQLITSRIHDLVELANQEKDHATHQFLQWFVTEQVEEEQSVEAIIVKLRMVKDSPSVLYMLDREMASRATEG